MGAFHWSHVLAIAIGGSLGAIGRYGVTQFTSKWWSHGFPMGTFLANMAGCFLMGLAFVWFTIKYPGLAPQWRSFIAVGFLGAFTTFSSYAIEALTLIEQGQSGWAATYLVVSVLGGMAAVAAGYGLAKQFL